ncbi:hypothetical protein [Cystobacter fuscus]|uniref:hypothetical protein n=1 Tax=Cystobacter fuscus TaxID=43 RepID=UPI002B31A3A9|nr:hypothetical protein F0U63_41260 [Cystobacter fuscus]
MKPAVSERFDKEWEGAAKQAMAFAIRLSSALHGGGLVPAVRERAEEYVHEAIKLTLDESRAWNPDKVPLGLHLCGVVRSLISNEIRSAAARLREEGAWEETAEARADMSVPRPITPEEFYLSKETCEVIENDAYQAADKDEELMKVVEAVVDGAFDIDMIAKATGLPSKSIYSAKDKLKKRRNSILKNSKQGKKP